jgi:hypothetical protein
MVYVIRILTLPFVLGMLLIALVKSAFNFTVNYMRFGGELLAHKQKNSTRSVSEVYDKINELIDKA